MATISSSGSGDFSAGGTWVGGAAPGNGDGFVIASGHVVDFDLDTSGFAAGFAASTINGTLRAKRSAGTHYLKMNGTLTVSTTGTLDASDGSGGAYRSDATFTILLNGNFSVTVSGSGAANLICGEPTHKHVRLAQAESAGATTLHVDTDVTADALWASGALIRVDNVNQAAQSEERTVSGVPTVTTITIAAGLTAANAQGAYVILISRNVKILGASSANGTAINGGTGGVIGAEIRSIATGVSGAASASINGTISNCGSGTSAGTGSAVNAPISGCTTGVANGQGHVISGLISGCTTAISTGAGLVVTGSISGCTTGVSGSAGPTFSGTLSGCTQGVSAGSGVLLLGASLSNNSRDLNQVSGGRAVNTLLGSGSEYLNYNASARSSIDYFESLDHDQVAGAFRAWTKGGITSSVASPVYNASRPRSYNAVCESASAYAFFQRQVLVPAYGSVYARCYVRKDASMAYLPRLWVFSAEKEPLLGLPAGTGSPDAEAQMTDSVDTWEVLEATVTNATDAAKVFLVRCLAKNASGNVSFDPIIRTSKGVSRARLVNAA